MPGIFKRIFLISRNQKEIDDTFLLLEHPNTYTLGKTADRKNLIAEGKNFSIKIKFLFTILIEGGILRITDRDKLLATRL